jgi:hypothetical protein
VLGVGNGITDGSLEEGLQDSSGFYIGVRDETEGRRVISSNVIGELGSVAKRLTLVNETRDTLDTTSTSETPDGGLGDSLDVVSQNLPVSLSASLSKTYRIDDEDPGRASQSS